MQTSVRGHHHVPPCFLCAISLEVMVDPVITPYGNTFERREIEKWLEYSQICPLTRKPLCSKQLVTNRALKELIIQWHENTKLCTANELTTVHKEPKKSSSVKNIDEIAVQPQSSNHLTGSKRKVASSVVGTTFGDRGDTWGQVTKKQAINSAEYTKRLGAQKNQSRKKKQSNLSRHHHSLILKKQECRRRELKKLPPFIIPCRNAELCDQIFNLAHRVSFWHHASWICWNGRLMDKEMEQKISEARSLMSIVHQGEKVPESMQNSIYQTIQNLCSYSACKYFVLQENKHVNERVTTKKMATCPGNMNNELNIEDTDADKNADKNAAAHISKNQAILVSSTQSGATKKSNVQNLGDQICPDGVLPCRDGAACKLMSHDKHLMAFWHHPHWFMCNHASPAVSQQHQMSETTASNTNVIKVQQLGQLIDLPSSILLSSNHKGCSTDKHMGNRSDTPNLRDSVIAITGKLSKIRR